MEEHVSFALIRTWEAFAQFAQTDGSTAAVRFVAMFIRRAVKSPRPSDPSPIDQERRAAILGRFLAHLTALDERRLAAIYRRMIAVELGADLQSLCAELGCRSGSATGLLLQSLLKLNT